MTTPDTTYEFHTTTKDGSTTTWTNLSKRDAQHLYRITAKQWPDNIKQTGWNTTPKEALHDPFPRIDH